MARFIWPSVILRRFTMARKMPAAAAVPPVTASQLMSFIRTGRPALLKAQAIPPPMTPAPTTPTERIGLRFGSASPVHAFLSRWPAPNSRTRLRLMEVHASRLKPSASTANPEASVRRR